MKAGGNGERAPLRTVLQNFLNHVETLEKRKNGGDDQYDKEFQELKLLSESLKGLSMYSCKEGEKEVNRRKNRYKDILPFDCTRVILSEIAGIPGSDYVNANYIRGASGSQAYIASQGPLVHTVTDFWRMVVECDVQVIIMACNEEESGKHKCECYWAESDKETRSYGPYTVKLLKSRRMCNDFNLRTMELIYVNATGETITRTVVQFHYWAWPDHGVPALVRPLLDMVRLIRDCQASETLPLLIHCSAGCGRTGTICAIDYVWGLLRAGKLMENFSLFELISDMRRQRVAMVQTKDQYILVHRALRELFIEQLKMIDAHPYENLDVNGHPLICPPQEIRIDPSYETIFVKVNPTVLEVNEEDDVCHEEPVDQIPWPVLQFQSNLTPINSAPPLPDKKKKSGGTSSGQGSPVSNPGDAKKTVYVGSSESSSKESSPLTSLERTLLKSSDTDPTNDSLKEEEEVLKPKASPKSGLTRKSSILKIRAFFEKSHSEPRTEKKANIACTRKASSFRLREGPKFYRSLEDDHPLPLTEKTKKEANECYSSKKLTVALGPELDGLNGFPPSTTNKETQLLSASNAEKNLDEKPSLPVKRSKSMKVYRGFDIRSDSNECEIPTTSQTLESAAAREVIVPATCGVVLSKTPSVTYISSKDKLYQSVAESTAKHVRKPPPDRCINYETSLPLATSSLDRGKEQRFAKPTSFPGSPTTCGSLDRGVVENKITPTYVNVLMRNQEVANTTKLDSDTRQLLHDCQAYLMHGDGSDMLPSVEEKHQRSTPHVKKHKNQPLKERRHSFKNAVVQHPDHQESSASSLSRETGEENYAVLESFDKVMQFDDEEAAKSRSGRKIHEYEAIWLSSKKSAAGVPASETAVENTDTAAGLETKDSVFVQKSDEIRLLLNELQNAHSEGEPRQPSPVVIPMPTYNFLTHAENPSSPRLHPDRVLSELQELVERANRNKEETAKSEAFVLPTLSIPPTLQRVSPSSPSTLNPLRLNPQLPVSRKDVPSPTSPSSSQFFVPAPSSILNTPSPGLISPIPIKITPSAPSPPIAPSFSAAVGPCRSSPSATDATQQPATSNVSITKISPKSEPQPVASLPVTKAEPKAPAFRPPPPYPTKFYVKMPSVSKEVTAIASTSAVSLIKASPQVQRRMPPEYKAPPPVKHVTQAKVSQPVAPPRSKRQVTSASQLPTMVAFPKGPPIPTRTFSSAALPGIDVDAVAAVMAAAENSSARGTSTGGSSSPTTAANKALSKALGKFHATAASFKTKLAQLSDGKDGGGELPAVAASQSKVERESSFAKQSDGATMMNPSEATSYARKKQHYL